MLVDALEHDDSASMRATRLFLEPNDVLFGCVREHERAPSPAAVRQMDFIIGVLDVHDGRKDVRPLLIGRQRPIDVRGRAFFGGRSRRSISAPLTVYAMPPRFESHGRRIESASLAGSSR